MRSLFLFRGSCCRGARFFLIRPPRTPHQHSTRHYKNKRKLFVTRVIAYKQKQRRKENYHECHYRNRPSMFHNIISSNNILLFFPRRRDRHRGLPSPPPILTMLALRESPRTPAVDTAFVFHGPTMAACRRHLIY